MTVTNGAEARSAAPGVDARQARHGGLTYLAITAADVRQSAAFYEHVLGWSIDWRSSSDARFSDPTGHLIGRFAAGSASEGAPGLLPYFYVNQLGAAVERVLAQGGEVTRAPFTEGNLLLALVRDPAGNDIGLWQGPSR